LARTCTATAAVPLPSLGANPAEVSVSGLSAGGFAAVQLHVAYSATFKRGAGVVAGGPYYCAEGSVLNATGRCMAHGSGIPVSIAREHHQQLGRQRCDRPGVEHERAPRSTCSPAPRTTPSSRR
jgi:poly(3-hydroxybutyrate) depolymerase